MLTGIIIACVIGAIAGWLAGLLVQGTGFGLVGDIVVGILGALIAGFLFPVLGITLTLGGGVLGAIILAFIGAVILLVIVRLFKSAPAQSPNGVKTLDPPGAIKAEGTWSLGARAGDFVFVAGMQGIDPKTNALVKDPQSRIRQAFLNIKLIAASEGASLRDCVRLTVYLSDLPRFAPMVEKAQAELWGGPPYPPRTMIEVKRLYDDDIAEIDSVFYAPVKK